MIGSYPGCISRQRVQYTWIRATHGNIFITRKLLYFWNYNNQMNGRHSIDNRQRLTVNGKNKHWVLNEKQNIFAIYYFTFSLIPFPLLITTDLTVPAYQHELISRISQQDLRNTFVYCLWCGRQLFVFSLPLMWLNDIFIYTLLWMRTPTWNVN